MFSSTLWSFGLFLLLVLPSLVACLNHGNAAGGIIQRIQYSREFLLRYNVKLPLDGTLFSLIQEHKLLPRRKRKRGKKGGIRQRLKKLKHRLPLPTCMLIHAQSLRHKTEELSANLRYLQEYRGACLLAITESWLNENDPTTGIEPSGFTAYRLDRDLAVTGKQCGGGVCLLIRDAWCGSAVVRERLCTPHIELLCVSLRPYYLPREFPQLFFTVVYIPPYANSSIAAEEIFNLSQKLETLSPDAPKFILGDFNSCTLKNTLRSYQQYVKSFTRKKKTIDLCYGTVPGAYLASALPPLGTSDHNVVFLQPVYQRLLQREKPQIRTIKIWNEDSITALQGCFECTLWDTFDCSDLNQQVDVISDYIQLCVDSVVPTKTVKKYANDHPWVSKKLKNLLHEKRVAHTQNNEIAKKEIQQEIRRQVKADKLAFKEKVQTAMASGNSREAWQGIKTMTNVPHKGKAKTFVSYGKGEEQHAANELNKFFSRFENVNGLNEIHPVISDTHSITVNQADVCSLFKKINPRKSPGPDKIGGNVLRHCADHLSPVFTALFQSSLDQHIVPRLWKTSIIIPVPKVPRPSDKNHFRPVALTPLAMKCFERIVKQHIIEQTQSQLDPFQFAYQCNKGVDDAILTLLNLVLSHLNTPRTCAKILFFDFASAFNTMLPNVLAQRLCADFSFEGGLISWILDFLSQRVQQVQLGSVLSDKIVTNIGSPQGCVLSPLLYILYTNSCTSSHSGRHLVKFADDTALISLLQKDEMEHGPVLNEFISWCDDSHLILNAAKTKEPLLLGGALFTVQRS